MHTEIDYSRYGEDDNELKRYAAVRDLKNWYGAARFNKLHKAFKAEGKMEYDQFAFMVGISGVTGYPVRVWYEMIWD